MTSQPKKMSEVLGLKRRYHGKEAKSIIDCSLSGYDSAIDEIDQFTPSVEKLAEFMKMIRCGGTIKDDYDQTIHLVLGDCYDKKDLTKIAGEIIKNMDKWLVKDTGVEQ